MKNRTSNITLFFIDTLLYSFFIFVCYVTLHYISLPESSLFEAATIKQNKTESLHKEVVVKKDFKTKVERYALYIDVTPKKSIIKILNIKPRFYQGICLKRGDYHILITKQGYRKKEFWVKVTKNTKIRESLSKETHSGSQ